MLVLLALMGAVSGASEQRVFIEVAAAWQPAGLRLEVETVWLGQERLLVLSDDGSVPGDHPGDGVYSGLLMGAPARILPVHLFVTAQGLPRTEIAAVDAALGLGESRLVWALETDGHPIARPVALALPPPHMEIVEPVAQFAAFGWVGLVFAYVTWLVQRLGPRRRSRA